MDANRLIDQMLAGDRVALAKLITLVENRSSALSLIMQRIYPYCGRAYIIGITGPPGAGKSTLVDKLVASLRRDSLAIGVVAVDPSSPFTGGALLGDRIRMQSHFLDHGVFIRSLSTRGCHGGLARATREIARLLDASGKDFLFLETVGVGQTELDIMAIADTVVVVLVPEAGDSIQAMKAGLLEIAHIFVVNKADREGALRMKTELETMLHLRGEEGWQVPVVLTEATHDVGTAEVMEKIRAHRQYLVERRLFRRGEEERRQRELIEILADEVKGRLQENIADGYFKKLIEQVKSGEIDPYSAAIRILSDREKILALLTGSHHGHVRESEKRK